MLMCASNSHQRWSGMPNLRKGSGWGLGTALHIVRAPRRAWGGDACISCARPAQIWRKHGFAPCTGTSSVIVTSRVLERSSCPVDTCAPPPRSPRRSRTASRRVRTSLFLVLCPSALPESSLPGAVLRRLSFARRIASESPRLSLVLCPTTSPNPSLLRLALPGAVSCRLNRPRQVDSRQCPVLRSLVPPRALPPARASRC